MTLEGISGDRIAFSVFSLELEVQLMLQPCEEGVRNLLLKATLPRSLQVVAKKVPCLGGAGQKQKAA